MSKVSSAQTFYHSLYAKTYIQNFAELRCHLDASFGSELLRWRSVFWSYKRWQPGI